ncbi:MAG: hypothetical protein ILP19_00810, partial [Oscillospiraceae bacterium]|nr:hypothetical protein [Oscillospiraceae bacterium]
MIIFYTITLLISVVLTMIFSMRKQKHTNVYFSLVFAFVPITLMGYMLRAGAQDIDTALIGNDIVYLGGCYMILFVMFSVTELSHMALNRFIKTAFLFINSMVYLCIVTNHRFYTNVWLVPRGTGNILIKEYGPVHTLFIGVLVADYILTVAAIFYGYFVKKDCSKRIIRLMMIPLTISFLCYFIDRFVSFDIELVAVSYLAAQVIYIVIMRRISLYDLTDSAIDSMSHKGDIGLISFDQKMRFLGCNERAAEIIPALSQLSIDKPVRENAEIHGTILRWIDLFKENEQNDKFYYEYEDGIYLVDVNVLHDGAHKRGYQIVINDDTENQKLQKAQHIMEMLDNLVMSMAMMVESRDNSTGGHIKRTREGVRILVEEIQSDNTLNVSEKFCKDLIRAAPMHDLGKRAVDDAVLRKPGRFTPEEFEKMKKHAPEGARI